MTKDEALDLALEALEELQPDDAYPYSLQSKAITAIKQARSAPVQPMAHIVGEIDHAGKVWKPAQRQWVEVEQVKWEGNKLIAKLKEKNNG